MWKRKRPDGTLVARVPGYRQMMPYLMKNKNESHVYIKYTVDMENAMAFLENPPGNLKEKVTVTMLLLRALTLVLDEYPRMNRFVSGRRIYQRDKITFSFSAKKAFDQAAPLVVIKMQPDSRKIVLSATEYFKSHADELDVYVEAHPKRELTEEELESIAQEQDEELDRELAAEDN